MACHDVPFRTMVLTQKHLRWISDQPKSSVLGDKQKHSRSYKVCIWECMLKIYSAWVFLILENIWKVFPSDFCCGINRETFMKQLSRYSIIDPPLYDRIKTRPFLLVATMAMVVGSVGNICGGWFGGMMCTVTLQARKWILNSQTMNYINFSQSLRWLV